MQPPWFRLAYALEFLLALIAISVTWSQIGGQTHLDLMAWPWKFVLTVALAWAIVRFTAAVAAEEKLWNLRSAAWLVCGLLLIVTMAAVTYYYHLNEPVN